MKYKRIRVELREYPKRLNRILLIREDLNMVEVGVILCNSLKCWMEHMFLFRKGNEAYVPEMMYEEYDSDIFFKMSDYTLNDFDGTFYFCYDLGDEWNFKCKVLETVEKEGEQLAYMEDADGLGIWENEKSAFDDYINGYIKPNSSKENPAKGYFLPENLMITKYGEFDDFDFHELKEDFEKSIEYDVYDYVMSAHENGYEMNVEERRPDFEDDNDEVDEMFEGFEGLATEYATLQINNIPRVKRVYETIKNDADEKTAFELIQGTLLKNILKLTAGIDERYLLELEDLISPDIDDMEDFDEREDDFGRKFN